MKKTKQILVAGELLAGKRIKIYTQFSGPWAFATVKGYTGSYLLLENVFIWNGETRATDHIHAQSISKIELI